MPVGSTSTSQPPPTHSPSSSSLYDSSRTHPQPHPGLRQYHRSLSSRSVSDVVKQFEAKSNFNSQQMTPDFAPDTGSPPPSRISRRPSGVPSRISSGSGSGLPTLSKQHDSTGGRRMSRESSRESGYGNGMGDGNGDTPGPSRMRLKASGIGLGTPLGMRPGDKDPSTSPRLRPARSTAYTSSSSSIPRPFPTSASMPRNLSASAMAHPPTTSPPSSSSTSLARSTSDNFSSFSSSSFSSRPSYEAGPSRNTSPTKRSHPVVAISVSRPTPDKRIQPIRRGSSKVELVHTTGRSPTSPTSPKRSGIPLPSRPSYRSASSSVSSQGSGFSNYYSPANMSPSRSPFTRPIPIESELNPVRAASMPMDRGISSRSRGSQDRVVDLASPTPSSSGSRHRSPDGSPRPAARDSLPLRSSLDSTRVSIEIPRRTSSAGLPASPTSGSPKLSQGPPNISPRRSSMASSLQQNPRLSLESTRSALREHAMSGQTLLSTEEGKLSASSSMHSRQSSSSSTSRRTASTYPTVPAPPKAPTSPDSVRRSPFVSRPASNASSSSHQSPFVSPPRGPSRALPNSSPRRSPGLIIKPPPPPPSLSLLSSSAAQPSPPIPAKSPLRDLNRQRSGQLDSPFGTSLTPRSASAESTLANAGSPTSALMPTSNGEEDPSGGTPMFRTPFDGQGPPSTAGDPPSQILATPSSEIRFTTLTVPSIYSQDSAPPSATSWALSEATARSADSWNSQESAQGRPRRLDSVSWGQKRGSQSSQVAEDMARARRTSSLPRLSMPLDKVLPKIPTETPTTATTYDSSLASNNASTGHTPISPVVENRREPIKSPSLPAMRRDQPATRERSKTSDPSQILLPPATLREDEDGVNPLRPLLPNSPSIVMSKRSHLIREIATTERAYAKDLALIRDAYMYRLIRPLSGHSGQTNGDSSFSPGNPSDASRRSSVYTYQTAETKRSSGYDSLTSSWVVPHQIVSTPLPESPSEGSGPSGSPSYFPSTAQGSTASFHGTPQFSPMKGPRSSVAPPSMPPPIGKPLSPADMKAVFLNLDQLAGAADELASAFEQAMGEDAVGPGASSREGEVGTDRIGEVFTAILPRLRPMYIFYCSRQSQGSVRLTQLQAEPAHAAHLNDCWNRIKSRTHAWNLDSMLIKPVQRITKYPLLFDDLLTNTTPVHPDYFAIRTAAQMSRAVAVEIDDAKRRQDVVSSAIGTKKGAAPIALVKNEKQPTGSKLLGLKRFRKEKASINPSSTALTKSASSMDLAQPPTVPDASLMLLRDLVNRVEELDLSVRKIGKEIVLWTAAAKEVFVAQDRLIRSWLKVVQLEPTDLADKRMLEFRRVIDGIVGEAWSDLNDEVRETIMPVFSKLLDSSSNPRKVIQKRDMRIVDYGRYQALKQSKKPIDRIIAQGANEFVALHTQLVDELPAFLEGYMRILDIALVGFARAQAKYHSTVKERLASFANRWIESSDSASPRPTHDSPDQDGVELSSGRTIVKAWLDAWSPYAEAMEHFQCTRPMARTTSRVATFPSKPSSGTVTRQPSRSGAASPMGPPRPILRHSASTTSQVSLSDVRKGSGSPNAASGAEGFGDMQKRMRSSSLRSQSGPGPAINLTAPSSPSLDKGSPSRFSLLRRSNSKSQVSRELTKNSTERPVRPPLSPRASSGLRPLSVGMGPSDNSSRHSWGLPRISQDPTKPMFEGIGLSPTKSQSSIMSMSHGIDINLSNNHGGSGQLRATSDPVTNFRAYSYTSTSSIRHPFAAPAQNESQLSLVSNATSTSTRAGLGFGDLGVGAGISIDDNDHVSFPSTSVSPVVPQFIHVQASPQIPASSVSYAHKKDVGNVLTNENMPAPSPSPASTRRNQDMDAAAGWRNESVLYQCACVADFEPSTLGNKRYRGLRFLAMVSGDLIDVFHEVGRIDELLSFPYPDVGVENDGVLVGRAEDGQIGLVICSFLEPLRD